METKETTYTCAACGGGVIVVPAPAAASACASAFIRSCNHDQAGVIAHLTATAYGESKVAGGK